MRRTKQLIKDVRFNTDNVKNSRYTDIRLLKFFNDAQRALQKLIHTSDTAGKYFTREAVIGAVSGQEEYDLPEDIFADNAVNSISRRISLSAAGSDYYTNMRMLTEKERRKEFGYVLQGRKFLVSPIPTTLLLSGLRTNYVYKLPTLSFRVGQVKSFISATEIKINILSLFGSDDISEYADHVSTVNRDGVITKSKIEIDSYSTSTGKITTTTDLTSGEEFPGGPTRTGVAIGDYVVIGERSTTHSELPEICEQMLTDLVERKIHAVDASKEITMAQMITSEEKADIRELFKDAEQDTKYPPIIDDTYLNI